MTEPDLALRKAVAEAVGWREVRQHPKRLLAPYHLVGTRPDGEWVVVPEYELNETACFRELIPWARDRRYRLLLEHLLPDGCIIDADGKLVKNPNMWVAAFFRSARARACYGEAETAAVAICKAVVVLAEWEVKDA